MVRIPVFQIINVFTDRSMVRLYSQGFEALRPIIRVGNLEFCVIDGAHYQLGTTHAFMV